MIELLIRLDGLAANALPIENQIDIFRVLKFLTNISKLLKISKIAKGLFCLWNFTTAEIFLSKVTFEQEQTEQHKLFSVKVWMNDHCAGKPCNKSVLTQLTELAYFFMFAETDVMTTTTTTMTTTAATTLAAATTMTTTTMAAMMTTRATRRLSMNVVRCSWWSFGF